MKGICIEDDLQILTMSSLQLLTSGRSGRLGEGASKLKKGGQMEEEEEEEEEVHLVMKLKTWHACLLKGLSRI